jgi:hypothetical protein
MEDKIYILQKDTVNDKAGTHFKKCLSLVDEGYYIPVIPPKYELAASGQLYTSDKVENNPEWFKPKEQLLNKDYEIVSFLDNAGGVLNYVNNKYRNNTNSIGLENCIHFGLKIHSVRRLSDGEVFSVGENNGIEILEFFIKYNDMFAVISGIGLVNVIDIKNKQKLFTTLDNVDIYKGQEVFCVTEKYNGVDVHPEYYSQLNNHYKYFFSNRTSANQYIIDHKPCLSLNDLLDGWDENSLDLRSQYKSAPMYKRFEKIAKQKINQ